VTAQEIICLSRDFWCWKGAKKTVDEKTTEWHWDGVE